MLIGLLALCPSNRCSHFRRSIRCEDVTLRSESSVSALYNPPHIEVKGYSLKPHPRYTFPDPRLIKVKPDYSLKWKRFHHRRAPARVSKVGFCAELGACKLPGALNVEFWRYSHRRVPVHTHISRCSQRASNGFSVTERRTTSSNRPISSKNEPGIAKNRPNHMWICPWT